MPLKTSTGGLEDYRSLILKKCKEAFLSDLLEFEQLSILSLREGMLGKCGDLSETFGRWWVAEEVETIEIKRSW